MDADKRSNPSGLEGGITRFVPARAAARNWLWDARNASGQSGIGTKDDGAISGGRPFHFFSIMNNSDVFGIIFGMDDLFTNLLKSLDFPSRWSLLGTSKEVNARTKTMLVLLLQIKAIPSLWDVYKASRTEVHERTKDFKFRGYQIGIPSRAYYCFAFPGSYRVRKEIIEPFLLYLMIFHNYCEQINWFFSNLDSCDGTRIMETIGVLGHWQILEQTILGPFLSGSKKPTSNRFADDGMTKMVAQRGDTVFWDKIVAADRKGRMKAYLESARDDYWLKRRVTKRDASPKRN
jgi:hypothetical protein